MHKKNTSYYFAYKKFHMHKKNWFRGRVAGQLAFWNYSLNKFEDSNSGLASLHVPVAT